MYCGKKMYLIYVSVLEAFFFIKLHSKNVSQHELWYEMLIINYIGSGCVCAWENAYVCEWDVYYSAFYEGSCLTLSKAAVKSKDEFFFSFLNHSQFHVTIMVSDVSVISQVLQKICQRFFRIRFLCGFHSSF